ncbi:YesL family protein [Alkalibacterium sp. f15]|uniref:YesL family protein n=1 Tax=Alkalibacterium sp. f15 TaxID=3414029 RepID=UPI003BF8EF25
MEEANGGSMDMIMKALDWLVTLAYLNLLWLGFSLLGLIVLGVGPATFAVHSIVKKKLKQGDLSHIFTKFKHEFKKHFKDGNIYFGLVTAATLFIYVDIRVIQALPQNSFIQIVVLPALIILSALVLIVATFTLGIYFEFDHPLLKSIKDGFWLALISPVAGLVMVHTFLVGFLIYAYIPALMLFYSLSFYAFITQWVMSKTFKRIKKKKYL